MMSKGFKASLLTIFLGVLVFLFGPMLLSLYPGLYCIRDEINITTGQGRHVRQVVFLRVSERTYDTALSEAITGHVGKAGIVAWHTVNTFAPPSTRYSPHYIFHGALTQARETGLFFESHDIPPSQRSEIAMRILKAWQMSGNDDGARDILKELWQDENISNQAVQSILVPSRNKIQSKMN